MDTHPLPASEPPVGVSKDAFLGGRFHLLQPKGHGFRSGLDALLLAALMGEDAEGRAADLGAGAGAAGFAAVCRCPQLAITLVEIDPRMAELARASLRLAENAALAPRLGVVEADVLLARPGREAAGLRDASFQTILTNPPFHAPNGRASPDPLRDRARAMAGPGCLQRWIRSAAALLETGGLFAMIARPDNLKDILDAAENRLGAITIMPVQPRADRPAHRILIRAKRGSHAGLAILGPVVLHEADGSLTAHALAIARGEAHLGGVCSQSM